MCPRAYTVSPQVYIRTVLSGTRREGLFRSRQGVVEPHRSSNQAIRREACQTGPPPPRSRRCPARRPARRTAVRRRLLPPTRAGTAACSASTIDSAASCARRSPPARTPGGATSRSRSLDGAGPDSSISNRNSLSGHVTRFYSERRSNEHARPAAVDADLGPQRVEGLERALVAKPLHEPEAAPSAP